MLNDSIRNFINSPRLPGNQRNFLQIILYHLAPTLFSHKPATLINVTNGHGNFKECWDKYNTCLSELFLSLDLKLWFYEIKKQAERTLVLFFNRELLMTAIDLPKSRHFLEDLGYGPGLSLNDSLETLKARFAKDCPHEAGIFLGIPLEDVKGFIENHGKNYLFNKYWKVYQNPEQARDIFNAYDKAKMKIFQIINQEF